MRPTIALRSRRLAIRCVVEAHHARNARVFSSALSGKDVDGSDLDILIDPTPEASLIDVAAIQVELEKLLGLPVDVLTSNALPEKFRYIVFA